MDMGALRAAAAAHMESRYEPWWPRSAVLVREAASISSLTASNLQYFSDGAAGTPSGAAGAAADGRDGGSAAASRNSAYISRRWSGLPKPRTQHGRSSCAAQAAERAEH